MSSSSESSLAELPQPYDISSAVSRALHMSAALHGGDTTTTAPLQPANGSGGGGGAGGGRSLSYPGPADTYYDFPAHSNGSNNASSYGENYSGAAYYCPSSGNPYYYHHQGVAGTTPDHPTPPHSQQQYLYPHHYSSIHPADAHVQMEVEAWSENTTISICNSSTTDLLDSKANMEQLDQFCKYIDSSGDEELISEKGETSMFGSTGNDYRCYSVRGTRSEYSESPPKKKRRSASTCVMSLSGYYEDDFNEEEEEDGDLRDWKVELDNACMWKEFDRVGTEMVITKAGRRMFPTLCLKVRGLDPTAIYSVKLDILPADNKRYKYLQSEWVAVGRSDKKQIYCEYEHPDSPNSGSYWMDKIIAFKMVKLTNNKITKSCDQVILNSMHKYLPCTKITCERDGYTQSFSFSETAFIAVTAYQSTGVTRLKINNNPYARAFRESLPSNSSQKSGGHYRSRHTSTSNRPSSLSPSQREHNNSSSRGTSPASSSSPHKQQGKQKNNCNSSVSVESGFESDTATDKRKDSTSFMLSQTHPFHPTHPHSLITYWSDDNSLWNPHLITPDPLMETAAGTFATTYLDDTSIETECEIVEEDSGDESEGCGTSEMLHQSLPKPDVELAEVEPAIQVDDDVFF